MKQQKLWYFNPPIIGDKMRQVRDEIERIAPEGKGTQAALIFEETFVNIASYAYDADAESAPLWVIFEVTPRGAHFIFEDEGGPFDITAAALTNPDPNQIGGYGIRYVQALSKKLSYARLSGTINHLEITL